MVPQDNGQLNVFIGNGQPLVLGGEAGQIVKRGHELGPVLALATPQERTKALLELDGVAGDFTRKLIADAEAGYPRLKASRKEAAAHPVESVMRDLRRLKSS